MIYLLKRGGSGGLAVVTAVVLFIAKKCKDRKALSKTLI
jgi:hypothetical protein